MKVIVSGASKTGTKSMAEALRLLDFTVYDYVENYAYLNKEWLKIVREGGSVDDFRRMYEGVDAVTDSPCNHFWEEIHKAFPDAKVINYSRPLHFQSCRTVLRLNNSIFSSCWIFQR